MDKTIAKMENHVVVCGWGRVGRSFCEHLPKGSAVVVVDNDSAELAACPYPHVIGDASDDLALTAAGIERAATMVAALGRDADNLFVVLSARSANPSAFIVARARAESSAAKLQRAGADRVVNPHEIGGARMAALVSQPYVSEFVDVVMHEAGMEFQLAEVDLAENSDLVGRTLGEAHLRARTGAMVLAMRHPDGSFTPNPSSDTVLYRKQILIVIGTDDQLQRLRDEAGVI